MAIPLYVMFILFAISSGNKQVYDLTHGMHYRMPALYGIRPVFNQSTTTRRTFVLDVPDTQQFCTKENAGTHISAPYSTNEKRWTVEQIPLENLYAPLVIIRFDTDTDNSGRYVLNSDLEQWERDHDMIIPEGSVVVLDSDWSDKWDTEDAYVSKFRDKSHFYPGFHLEACQYLMRRKVVGVGVDTMTIDGGENAVKYERPCHNVLSDSNIFVLENLKKLRYVPDGEAMIFVGALKMTDGTGSPARIFAVSNSVTNRSLWALIVVCWLIVIRF